MREVEFSGNKEFLSNMHGCNLSIGNAVHSPFPESLMPYWMIGGRYSLSLFGSSEHLYQACKSDDIAWVEIILSQESSHKTKTLARKMIGTTHALRPGFHKNKVALMRWIVTEKFLQNPVLMGRLKDTGDEVLIEKNYWGDTFWGQCKGVGKNHLGQILMDIRKQY